MILKTLRLENIRSYTSETIDFPTGTTLFEGDIGSGKSTILMAIEFALFGLGSEKGGALLRKGEPKGLAALTFSVDGQDYKVTRNLVGKGKVSVQQDKEGILETPQGTYHLSPAELKEKILQILGFNEPPDPKAQSLIYRYATFTPQEEMKTVIFAQPESRLQTLRKALHIEDYKIASTNASLIQAAVEKKASELKAAASDLEIIQEDIKCKEAEIEQDRGTLDTAKGQQEREEGALNQLRDELKKFQAIRVQLSEIGARIKPLEEQLKDKEAFVKHYEMEIQKREKRVKEICPFIEAFRQKIRPSSKTVEQIRFEIADLEEEDRRLRRIDTEIGSKITDYRSVETNGICPTCDRPADIKEFEEKIATKLKEKETSNRKVAESTGSLKQSRELLQSLQEYEGERSKFQQYASELEQLETETYVAKTAETEKEIQELSKTLQSHREEASKLEDVSQTIGSLDEKIKLADSALQVTREKVVKLSTRIDDLNRSVIEDKDRANLKLKQKNNGERLTEYRIWLESFFIPTLGLIEKNILTNANQEFNQHFQRWFSLLVEDVGKGARVDETFTPIVEQDGYEQDMHYLSGGEKTSVALAYRLALNTLVQRVSSLSKSNILILDEPTDGFSKEQLSRVKDILDELECPQVIIVSHERELESFADQVFNIAKEHGISVVRKQEK